LNDDFPSICGSDNRTNWGVDFFWINKSGAVETPTTKVAIIEVVVGIILSFSPP
jgi:hypothetical protein